MEKRTPSSTGSVAHSTASPTIESVTAELFRRMDPVLRGLARKIAGEWIDQREDFFQEGALGVVKAIASFKPNKGNLDHYATRCARGRMLNYRRSLSKRVGGMPLDLLIETGEKEKRSNTGRTARRLLSDRDQIQEAQSRFDGMIIWNSAAGILTPKERKVIESIFFDGIRANETARKMGLSAPRVTQLYSAGIAKLQARFGY
jgi:RNA polymerase sigma factor (sigma-70 family)